MDLSDLCCLYSHPRKHDFLSYWNPSDAAVFLFFSAFHDFLNLLTHLESFDDKFAPILVFVILGCRSAFVHRISMGVKKLSVLLDRIPVSFREKGDSHARRSVQSARTGSIQLVSRFLLSGLRWIKAPNIDHLELNSAEVLSTT